MKIILLLGEGNSGKTTTCELLRDYLLEKCNRITQQGMRQYNFDKSQKGDLNFLCELGKKKILISSQGDILSKVKEKINKYTDLIQDGIFVFACRIHFTEVIELAKAKSGENFVQILKNKANNEDNDRALKEILKEIEL